MKRKIRRESQPIFIIFLKIILIPGLLFFVQNACAPDSQSNDTALESSGINTLSKEEAEEGWILLFDGESFEGWRGLGRESVPLGVWTIEEGAIKKIRSSDVPTQEDGQPLAGGDILTEKTFMDFELSFQWKISTGGNSGVKYNVSEEMSTASPPQFAALGFEYQILDDQNHPDAENGADRTAAALYDLVEPKNKTLKPVGEWNSARIVFRGNHGEHWLNGVKVLHFDLGTPEMKERLETSKYRIYDDFGRKRRGHIVIQDHTDAAWYRNIKIKEL